MSDETPERDYIRKDDYYGGSLWVEIPSKDDDPEIKWIAYGGFGETTLRLVEAREVKALIVALEKAGRASYWDWDEGEK